MKKNTIKDRKGVTLIALVVTIIILVILATITLNWALGNEGIFKKVFEAKDMAQMEAGREHIGLKVFELQTEKLLKGESCPLEYINENLEARLEGCTIVGTRGEPIEKIYVKYRNYQYEILGTGEINFIGDVEFSEVPDLIVERDKTVTGVEKVILSLNANVEMGSIKKIITPTGDRTEKEFTYEITQNGEYEFKAVTAKGIETVKKIDIQNIKEEGLDLTGLTTGDEITHDHIYEGKYDQSTHWEECYICNSIQNKVNHNLTISGTEGCDIGLANQTQYCTLGCGYSKNLTKKEHVTLKWGVQKERYLHFKACTVCGVWTKGENCYNVQGKKLGCATGIIGTCVVCENNYTEVKHQFGNNGKCDACKKKLYDYTIEVNKLEELIYKVRWVIKPIAGVEITGVGSLGSCTLFNSNTKYEIISQTKNSKGEWSVEIKVIFDKINVGHLAEVHIYSNIIYEGVTFSNHIGNDGANNEYKRIAIDSTAPNKKNIYVEGIGQENFSRKATITATFEEYLDDSVQMALYDGNQMISNWKSATKEGNNFTATFDVISETNTTKELTVKAKDRTGNIGEGKVNISKLDSKAPELLSKTEYNDIWNIRKNIKLEIKDEGIGKVQIAFNDPNTYSSTIQEGNSYIKVYNFTGDVYEDVVGALYLKDGLGNITTKKITIGKIDSTSPTITGVKKENGKVIIEANDINIRLNKEGSGILGYAISKSKEVPANSMFQTSNEFTVEKEGTHYVYVKDRAGNLSEKYEIKI